MSLPDEFLTLIDDRDRSWMVDANCRGMGPDLFYARRGEDVAQIKAICWGTRGHAPCPVREQCESYGMREHFGVWGALSERERRAKRREGAPGSRGPVPGILRPINHGSESGYDRHRERGEEPCRACREANAAKSAAWKEHARTKAVTEAHTAHLAECDCLTAGAVVDVMRACCDPACVCHRTLRLLGGAA